MSQSLSSMSALSLGGYKGRLKYMVPVKELINKVKDCGIISDKREEEAFCSGCLTAWRSRIGWINDLVPDI